MLKRRLRAPSPALVISLIALFVALGGTTYAATSLPANSIGTKQLKKNAVTARKIKNGAVVASKTNPAGLTVPNATHATTAGSAPPSGSAGGGLTGNYPNPGLAPAEAWHEIGASGQPAFFNGWTNSDPANLTTAGFFKDPWGVVHLKGVITGPGNGLPFFALPAGYRPSKMVLEELPATTTAVDLEGVTFRAGED
jgi:hypothetical protein